MSVNAGPTDGYASRRPARLLSLMVQNALNKKVKGTTLLSGESAAHEELVRCDGCSQPVAVPYAGAVTCLNCRHETHWLSRYDHARRKTSVPIESVVVK